MNGRELEHVLSLIDANVGANQAMLRVEILDYILGHQDEVLKQLALHGSVSVPTSSGILPIALSDLHEAVA